MNLHNKIMNIQINLKDLDNMIVDGIKSKIGYKQGHKSARHQAAELSIQADIFYEQVETLVDQPFQSVDELKLELKKLLTHHKN